MVKDLLAAHRYARALFEIAREMHQDEVIEAELESLAAALKASPEIEKFLTNPRLKIEEKKSFLGRIYQALPAKPEMKLSGQEPVRDILLNFFLVLFEKNRFYLIHEIAVHFKRVADEAQGQGVAEISTAVPLKSDAQAAIVNRLEKIAGYKITVRNKVDPSLIGGVMVKVRNKVIDDTVRYKIEMFKKELTKVQSI
jgi:F-type H+-transporting ATPase subunit delta